MTNLSIIHSNIEANMITVKYNLSHITEIDFRGIAEHLHDHFPDHEIEVSSTTSTGYVQADSIEIEKEVCDILDKIESEYIQK